MVILITGAKGQLGSELNNILQRGSSELGKLPPVYAGCEVLAVDVDELDITSADAVDSFFSRHKPDLVFNCAAMTNVDGCESDEETATASMHSDQGTWPSPARSMAHACCMSPPTMCSGGGWGETIHRA